MMHKNLTTLALAAALAVLALNIAQAQADFSGTWAFDEAKSDPAGGGRPGGGRMGGGPPSKLVIAQTGSQLSIETTNANGTQTATYKLDGSESVNQGAMSETRSKATWDGSNLVITGKMAISTPQGDFGIDVKDVYSVTAGVLTLTTTRVTPRGETTRKLVFNKA